MSNNNAALRILFIEGYSQIGPGMESSFLGYPRFGHPHPTVTPFTRHSIFRVWCTDPDEFDIFEDNGDGDEEDDGWVRPDAFGVKRCRDEIMSGNYHAIVVIDYSDSVKAFEGSICKLLQNFVRAGGVVAFPTSEGKIVETLQKYFGVKWDYTNYYRTLWGPYLEDNESNILRNFGGGTLSRNVIKDFSAKANVIWAPKHERCFGVTERSFNRPYYQPPAEMRGKSEDYDAVVAVHDFGKGAIAYFGDMNLEEQTIALVAAFLESRSPESPIGNLPPPKDDFSELEKLWGKDCMGSMEWAIPGDTVKFRGLTGATHLNGTEGKLIYFIDREQRWSVRCFGSKKMVKAKPENLLVQVSHFRMSPEGEN